MPRMNACINTSIVATRFAFVVLLASFIYACDSDDDNRQLINLVTIAEQGFTRIEINGDTNTVIETGESTQLSLLAFTDNDLTGTAISPDDVDYSSSDINIAEVDSRDGTVFGRNTDGTAVITANFGNLSTTAEVRVSSAELVSIDIVPLSASNMLDECSATQFTAFGSFEGEAEQRNLSDRVIWTVAQTSAAFSDTGLLRVTAAGMLAVTATRAAGPNGGPEVVQTDTFTVLDNLEAINIVPDAGELRSGSPLQYRAFPVYSDDAENTTEITDNVDWTIEDVATSGSFAQVDNTLPDLGLVTPSRAGDGELNATCPGTSISQSLNISAQGSTEFAELEITAFNAAREAPLTIEFDGDETTEQLVATALFLESQGGLDVTNDAEWSITSGSETIFEIGNREDDDRGLLTIRGTGTVTIMAIFTDEDNDDAIFTSSITVNSEDATFSFP